MRIAPGVASPSRILGNILHRTFLGSVERGERHLSILNLRRITRVQRVPLARLLAPRTSSEGEDRDSASVRELTAAPVHHR